MVVDKNRERKKKTASPLSKLTSVGRRLLIFTHIPAFSIIHEFLLTGTPTCTDTHLLAVLKTYSTAFAKCSIATSIVLTPKGMLVKERKQLKLTSAHLLHYWQWQTPADVV